MSKKQTKSLEEQMRLSQEATDNLLSLVFTGGCIKFTKEQKQ